MNASSVSRRSRLRSGLSSKSIELPLPGAGVAVSGAPVVVFEANDVIFAEVVAGLHLDEDQLGVARVLDPCAAPSGMSIESPDVSSFGPPSRVTTAKPSTTTQCSAR